MSLHHGPISFVYSNAFLKLRQITVADTGVGLYFGNGSLWTLFFEFLCYLLLAVLAVVGLLRRRGWVTVITLVLFATLATVTLDSGLSRNFSVVHNNTEMEFLILSVVFMTGCLIYLYRDRLPDSFLLALACGVGFVASLYLPTNGNVPTVGLTVSSLGAFLLAYPLLWLGAHLPLQRLGAKNDYSYGVYIYAYPLTQLLVLYNAERFGFVPFMMLTGLVTAAFAVASWWLIEKRALRLKRVHWRSGRTPRNVADADEMSPPEEGPGVGETEVVADRLLGTGP